MDNVEADRAEAALIIRDSFTSREPECDRCRGLCDIIEDEENGILVCRCSGIVVLDTLISRDGDRIFADDRDSKQTSSRVGQADDASMNHDVATSVFSSRADGVSKQTQAALDPKRKKKLQEAQRLCEMMCVHCRCNRRIQDDCMVLFDAVDQKLNRKSLEAVIAACLLAAMKYNDGLQMNINEIAHIADVSSDEIKQCWKIVSESAKVVFKSAVGDGSQHSKNGSLLVPKFCAMLLLPADVQRAAIEMCPSILQLKAGHTPVTIASTALLFALRLHHSQPPSIEDLVSVTKADLDCIKQCVREVYPQRAEFVPRQYATAASVENLLPLF